MPSSSIDQKAHQLPIQVHPNHIFYCGKQQMIHRVVLILPRQPVSRVTLKVPFLYESTTKMKKKQIHKDYSALLGASSVEPPGIITVLTKSKTFYRVRFVCIRTYSIPMPFIGFRSSPAERILNSSPASIISIRMALPCTATVPKQPVGRKEVRS